MRTIVSAIFFLTFSSPLLAQEKEHDWGFKSKTAKSALKSYSSKITKLNKKSEAELKKLEDKYKKTRKEQRLQLIMDLEKSLDEATKSGELDDAIKIRDAIRVLHGGAEPLGVPVTMNFEAKSPTKVRIPKDAKKFKGHHYRIINKEKTWYLAKRYCELVGGHLVRIQSPAEQEFVFQMVHATGKNNYWIDGSDQLKEGEWLFSNFEPMRYFNWEINQPDNYQTLEHHVFIAFSTGKWYDRFGGCRMPFVCEWDQ